MALPAHRQPPHGVQQERPGSATHVMHVIGIMLATPHRALLPAQPRSPELVVQNQEALHLVTHLFHGPHWFLLAYSAPLFVVCGAKTKISVLNYTGTTLSDTIHFRYYSA